MYHCQATNIGCLLFHSSSFLPIQPAFNVGDSFNVTPHLSTAEYTLCYNIQSLPISYIHHIQNVCLFRGFSERAEFRSRVLTRVAASDIDCGSASLIDRYSP